MTTSQQTPGVGLMLAHRLQRWLNIILTLGQRFVFVGLVPSCNHRDLQDIIEIEKAQIQAEENYVLCINKIN